jgi:hypothetical protein
VARRSVAIAAPSPVETLANCAGLSLCAVAKGPSSAHPASSVAVATTVSDCLRNGVTEIFMFELLE